MNAPALSAQALPSISIVTICKNAGPTIERTVSSVVRCTYPNLQYIVVDGGSTDDTCDRISRYRDRIDKFVSEPDGGISDALNKAVGLSDGDYHLVMHADDELLPESIHVLAEHARATTQVVCGSVSVIDGGKLSREFVSDPRKLHAKMSVAHMGSLIRKEAWVAVGGYDLRRRIAMDHLLMLKILQRFGIDAFSVVDVVVANYFLGGVSDKQIVRGFRELRANLRETGSSYLRANSQYVQLLLRSGLARLIGRR